MVGLSVGPTTSPLLTPREKPALRREVPDSVSQTTAIKSCLALPWQVFRLDGGGHLTVAGQHRCRTGFPSARVVTP